MSETKHISLKNLQAFLKPLMRIINRKAESWEDLKNKPFGSTFAECTLIDKLRLLADEQWMTLGDFYFIEGQKYTVVFDDVTYDCTAYRDDYGTVDIGDITLVDDPHPKSQDVPFFIYSDMDYGATIFVEDNSVDHSILITGISETITKLPSKYVDIPNNILTEDNYLRITAGMQKGNGEVFNNYDSNYAYGYMSHAEGSGTSADGEYSHAEGLRTTAAGEGSHAEGDHTTASGDNSHAEGYNTEASGLRAHAEGYDTVASENCSHAEGIDTTATGAAQHVQGKQNIADIKYAHIVGNGDYEASGLGGMSKYYSNAHTLDWGGNAWFAGNVYVGSISGRYQDDGSKKLATEEFVENSINSSIEVIRRNIVLNLANQNHLLKVVTNGETTVTITVPLDSDVNFPLGSELEIVRYGAAEVSIANAEGVVINSLEGSRSIAGQYGTVVLKKMGTNEWLLGGALA